MQQQFTMRPGFAQTAPGMLPQSPPIGSESPTAVAGYDTSLSPQPAASPKSAQYDLSLPATAQSAPYMPVPPLQSDIIGPPPSSSYQLGRSSRSPVRTGSGSPSMQASAYPQAAFPQAAFPQTAYPQAAYPQAVEGVSQFSPAPVPVPASPPQSAEIVKSYEATTVLTRPPTVEKGQHIEKRQVTEYVTVREEKVVQVPQVQVIEKQVPVTREVDTIVDDVRIVPGQAVETVSSTVQAVETVQAAPVVYQQSVKQAAAVEYVQAPPVAPAPAVEYVQAAAVEYVTPTPAPAVQYVTPTPAPVKPAPAVEYVTPTPAPAVEYVEPAPVVDYARAAPPPRHVPAVETVAASTVERMETPVSVPTAVLQPAPIVQEFIAPPPVMHAPPMEPAPAAPMKINMKPVIPFCAEFVGTFILVSAAGFAAMQGLGMGPKVMEMPLPGGTVAEAPMPRAAPVPEVVESSEGPILPGSYCRRCDGTLARINETGQAESTDGVSTLQVMQMAKSLQMEVALQKALNWAASTTCWCNNSFFNPMLGMAILLIIYAVLFFFIRPITGAYMNPAISFAAFLSGKLELMTMLVYMLAQVLGALLAALLFAFLVGFDCLGVGPRPGFSWWQANIVECLYTAFLAFTFLSIHPGPKSTAKDNKYNIFLYPLTMMAAFCAGLAAAAHISGAILNPAMTLAFQFMQILLTSFSPGYYWLQYIASQFLGGLLAAVVFWICRPDERRNSMSTTGEEIFSFFPLTTKLACEFVGTWILVFTIACSYWNGHGIESLAGAACLLAIYTAMCMVSGGHFNPAVTLAVMLSERHILTEALRDGLYYILIQILAGTLAAFEAAAVHSGKTFEATPLPASWGIWGLVEVLLTCILVLCFLACTRTRDETVVTHLRYQIGLVIAICFAIAGSVLNYFVMPGAYLNPASALGLSFAHLLNAGVWYGGLFVAFFDFVGGLAAYGVFTGFREYGHKSISHQFM